MRDPDDESVEIWTSGMVLDEIGLNEDDPNVVLARNAFITSVGMLAKHRDLQALVAGLAALMSAASQALHTNKRGEVKYCNGPCQHTPALMTMLCVTFTGAMEDKELAGAEMMAMLLAVSQSMALVFHEKSESMEGEGNAWRPEDYLEDIRKIWENEMPDCYDKTLAHYQSQKAMRKDLERLEDLPTTDFESPHDD